MAVYKLASQNKNTTAKGTTMSSLPSPVEEKKDFGEGLAYLGEKAAVGFVSSVEGIWDFAASGIAKLFGADDWAEEQIANDWFGDWYSHPDEWFQPTGGWKIAGDVASGIGTSLPGMVAATAGVAIGVASAGTLTPAAMALITGGTSAVVSGLGAAGRGVKEAYEQTGNLGGKEYLYGAGTGIVEGGIEGVMNAIGLGGVGSVFKNFGKSATKSMASRVGVAVVDGFLGEAFEEGFSELVTPYIKKFTYDPNAKNASLAEIGYAALVGGLSGALMGGGGAAVDVSSSLISGTKAVNNGSADTIRKYAEIATAFEDTNSTKDEYFERVASSYKALNESLAKTGGEIKTANQRMMLGDLARANVVSAIAPQIYKEAATILNDAEGYVKRFNENQYTDAEGKPIEVTVEELTKGFDASNPKSIREAIKTNDTLRTLSAMALAGKMMSNTSAMAESILKGERLKSQVDLVSLSERADPKEIEALSRELEIDDWSSLSLEDFNDRLEAYRERGGVEKYAERQKLVNKMKKIKQGKSVPKGVAGLKNGQVTRYSDGTLDVGVANVGGSYLLYDFNSGNESRLLTHEEINTYFREYSQEQYKAEQTKREQANAKRKAEVEELDTWARENITDYATLAASAKTMIRKVIRQARANGLSESDVKMWADMSAHSGIDVIFDKRLSEIKVKVEQEDGTVKTETRFANAYYDEKGNRIVVNPEARISQEKALFHELDHALRSFFGGGTPAIYKGALDSLDDTTKAALKEQYGSNEAIFNDEANAFYAAEVMGEKGFARSIATTKPKAFEKIMNFFKDAINYKNDGYSKAARKYYKQYKEMYEAFSAVNKGNNALEGAEGGKRYSYSSIESTFFGKNGISAEEFDKYKKTQGYKDYVDKCLNNMRQTRKDFNEATARKEIEDSIAGIVRVAKAAKKAGYDITDVAEDQRSKRDSKNRLLFSSLEPNSDYFTSNDLSTICDKQKNFTEIYEEIVRQEKALGVPPEKSFFKDVNNYFAIHKIMADKGMTTPCEQCYFNTMRKNLTPMAESFLKLVKEENENNKSNDALYDKKGKQKANNADLRKKVRKAFANNDYPITIEEMDAEMLTTRDGLARLKLQAPEIFEAFNSFYGQSKPKMPREATPFRFGELTALLTDSNGKISERLVKQIESTGGFRLQSYSDFQIANYVDVLQVIFEAGTLGLSGHAYTKVPAFLEATEGTNLKRNISVFMYKDGTEWRIDKGDSFPGTLEDIIALVKADKTGNTSIIDVVQNADNAAWLMANDDIGYGIPFHKSGAKMGVVREKVVKEDGREIKGYKDIKDHTRQQTEVWAKTTDDHKAFTKVKKGINIYEFWDFDNKKGLSKNELIEKNLKAYINACREAGYLPKFREYLTDNTKVLNDTLSYAKKLGFADANATIDDISFVHSGYRIPYGYYKFLGDFGMFKPNGEASPHKVLSLKDYDFAKAEKFFENAEQVKRNEILQQFANGEVREEYRKSDLTTSQLQEIIDAKRKEIAGGIISKRYATLPEGARAALNINSSRSKAQRLAKAAQGSYNKRRDPLINRTFPPYNESASEANERATRWAHKEDVKAGDERIAFYHNRMYLIQKTDDLHGERYIILRRVLVKEYNLIKQELEKGNTYGRIMSIEEEINKSNISNTSSNANRRRGSSVDSDEFTEEGRIYREVSRLGSLKTDGIERTEHNGTENSQRSSEDRQRREAVRLETDSNGKTLSEGQQEFFKDSKVRDEDGNLLVVYHGSPNKFTTFRQGVAEGWGKGIYFTDNRDEAINFGDNIVMAYLNITNPFDADTMNYDKIGAENTKAYRDFDMKKWQKWYSFEYDTYEEYQEDGMGVDMYEIYTEEKEVFNKILRELGYDGIIATGSNSINGLEIVAFNESQPKLTTNKNPTSDTDIRYSLDIDSIMEQTRSKVHAEPPEAQKPKLKESISTAWTGLQISLTNEQAGIEKIGKKFGIKDIDVTVQMARAAMNEAQEMIGGNQYRIGAEGKKEKQGEGLAKIFEPIDKLGKEEQRRFDDYLLHWHNISRMSLKEKSEAKITEAQAKYDAEVKKLESSMRKINKLSKSMEKEGADVKAIKKQLATERKNAASLRKSANALKKELNSLTVEENKPIFMVDDNGTERAVTAEESKAIIAKIDKEHPEYKAIAEKVWAYSRNLNQYRVDTGLISQEEFDYLNEKYPYYVPTYREGKNKGISAITGDSNLAIKLTVKTAKGSGLDVMAIKTIMARQTVEAIRAGRLNQMAKAVYDTIGKGNDYVVEVKREKNDDLEVNPVDERPKNNQITFFENGEKVTLAVTKEIFAGFEGFHRAEIADNILYQWTNAVNSGFKKLVTGWSPAFMIRNPLRDIQDAGLYTKYGKTFAKNYARVGKLILEDSQEWQLYRAMGGLSASLFNYDKGTQGSQNRIGFTKAEGHLLKKGVNAVENANMFVEQLPRFAEFVSALEAGVSPEQAILDAADITTNFGRTGKITKILNSTIVPFLNPSIQGFSKMIRTVTSIKTAREAGALFIKATLLGIAPMVLNMLMYGDDDEYKDLRENDKENNFLFKIGDTFIKIPRGRVASAIGGLVNRGMKTVKGEDADWKGYAENVVQQVTPVDSMTRTIFSPFYDVATNTTWYGTEIEGRQFENVAPSERYDESTSEIAKVIGKITKTSPKKWHYLIDQYSGFVGDFLLPATSKKAEKDFFSGNFTIDPATSNKISSDFYKMYDKAQYAKSSGDEVAKYQVKYLNKVKSTVSDLYKEKSAIQNSDLKGVEKLQQTRAIQILINQTFKTAMADYEAYTKAFETTSAIENEDYRYIESVRMVRGAESALKEYNEKVYEKYSLVAKSGISYDDLYYYYFVHKDLEGDKDKQGNTIAGSKSKKAVSLVNSLKISKNQKLLLLAASGYSVGDKATKVSLARYITSLKATKDEKVALAELCGYKVKNGTILLSAIK